ncbi:hypothetical protein Hanom_Chr14g01247971 [Helianthus anomalus]
MAGSQWPNQTHAPQPKPPTQAPPYSMGVGLSDGGLPFHVSTKTNAPTQAPPYPMVLKYLIKLDTFYFLFIFFKVNSENGPEL